MDRALDRQAPAIQLADWRRRIAEIYAAVRQTRDPLDAWKHWPVDRDRLFATHPQSPIRSEMRSGFQGLDYFDYDPAFRFDVELSPFEGDGVQWEIGKDGDLCLRPVALTMGLADRLGSELTLFWLTGYGGGLYLPFADGTSGGETYGGGRYLIDSIMGADLGLVNGRVVLDFNFAYYPSCAHDPRWTCPLAENRLPERVEAGQRG